MTPAGLFSAFRRKTQGKTKEELGHAITQLLKKLNPQKRKHDGKIYFFLNNCDDLEQTKID